MRTLLALVLLCAAFGAAAQTADDRSYTQAELEELLAPVALYPDSVLSNVLIAATFPVDVVQAARWSQANASLDAAAALTAVEGEAWDASVKALVAFPELLARMSDDIEWTQRVGDAFLYAEASVMDTIQGLREKAYTAGSLRTTEHVRVVRDERTIIVEPVRREVVYVPVYDPHVVYHSHSHVHWGRPVHVVPAFYYSSFFWPARHIVVVNAGRHGPPHRWRHRARHRPPAFQHRPPPRRDAHREWASQQRERFPRGIRGPRPVAPARAVINRGSGAGGSGAVRRDAAPPRVSIDPRGNGAVRGSGAVRRDAAPPRVSVDPRGNGAVRGSGAVRRDAAPPTLDRPANQFESRAIPRRSMPSRSASVVAPSRAAPPPRAAAPARAARSNDAARSMPSAPARQSAPREERRTRER